MTAPSVESSRAWFPVSAGLLTRKHYERIGSAWIVFLWMIHEQRRPPDGEGDTGAVRNGQPISYEDIGACLQGMLARTIEGHVAKLESEGYIRSEYIGGQGKRYHLTKPLRWTLLRRVTELANNSADSRSCNSAD